MKLGNLKELLKEKHVSGRELAQAVNVSPSTISGYMTGRREPDIETLVKISLFLSVSTDRLLGINKKTIIMSQEDAERIIMLQSEINLIYKKYGINYRSNNYENKN